MCCLLFDLVEFLFLLTLLQLFIYPPNPNKLFGKRMKQHQSSQHRSLAAKQQVLKCCGQQRALDDDSRGYILQSQSNFSLLAKHVLDMLPLYTSVGLQNKVQSILHATGDQVQVTLPQYSPQILSLQLPTSNGCCVFLQKSFLAHGIEACVLKE
jgi:hypothetical protein